MKKKRANVEHRDTYSTTTYILFKCLFCLDSPVVIPNHNDPILKTQWLIAKGLVEVVDAVECQMKWHMMDTHLTQFPFCVLFRAHLSSRHPLYEIFEAHCEGPVSATAIAMPGLLANGGYLQLLFQIGNVESIKLVNHHYQRHHYDDSDFKLLLKVSMS